MKIKTDQENNWTLYSKKIFKDEDIETPSTKNLFEVSTITKSIVDVAL